MRETPLPPPPPSHAARIRSRRGGWDALRWPMGGTARRPPPAPTHARAAVSRVLFSTAPRPAIYARISFVGDANIGGDIKPLERIRWHCLFTSSCSQTSGSAVEESAGDECSAYAFAFNGTRLVTGCLHFGQPKSLDQVRGATGLAQVVMAAAPAFLFAATGHALLGSLFLFLRLLLWGLGARFRLSLLLFAIVAVV